MAPKRTIRVVATEGIELGALRCGVLSDHRNLHRLRI